MGGPMPGNMGGPMGGGPMGGGPMGGGPMGGAPAPGGYAPYGGGGYSGGFGAPAPAANDPMWGYFTAIAGQVTVSFCFTSNTPQRVFFTNLCTSET